MNASVASQNTRRKLHREEFEKKSRNQNGEDFVNLCESKNLKTQVISC